jgi:IMP dehydrogenase
MDKKIIGEGITFDDVLIQPSRSKVTPREVDVATRLTRHIKLSIPIVSAAMDTVTEANLAIAIAREGGLGVIHKNFPVERQAEEVRKVKRAESVRVTNPITLPPDAPIREAVQLMAEHNISGIPITKGRKLLGIITSRDLRFEKDFSRRVEELMTPRERLVTAPTNISLEAAKEILHESRIEKLLLIDENFNLSGMITVKDIMKSIKFPNASKDEEGRLLVGAAVGVSGDFEERTSELIKAGTDVIVIDTAHGHSERVIRALKKLRALFPEQELIAGNIATASAAHDLIEAGADALKVGIGPGSICTTRVIAGIGVPQITAIMEVTKAASGEVPIIADGGIRYSGDITKALAAGAHVVMIGSLFAGTDESPGEEIIYEGRRFKAYRGMGSIAAMKAGSKDRYFQDDLPGLNGNEKLVAEGIEGRVEYKGPLSDYLFQLIGGVKAGMGYCGARNIEELRTKTQFIKVSVASARESHPHDVAIVREAPNYSH